MAGTFASSRSTVRLTRKGLLFPKRSSLVTAVKPSRRMAYVLFKPVHSTVPFAVLYLFSRQPRTAHRDGSIPFGDAVFVRPHLTELVEAADVFRSWLGPLTPLHQKSLPRTSRFKHQVEVRPHPEAAGRGEPSHHAVALPARASR